MLRKIRQTNTIKKKSHFCLKQQNSEAQNRMMDAGFCVGSRQERGDLGISSSLSMSRFW